MATPRRAPRGRFPSPRAGGAGVHDDPTLHHDVPPGVALSEVIAELRDIRAAIEAGGAPGALEIGGMPTRHSLTSATDNPITLGGSEDHAWEAVLIENPNKAPLWLGFASGLGTPASAVRMIPGQMGVLISVRFMVASVGADPAATFPATFYATRYDTPQAPIAYAFNPATLP